MQLDLAALPSDPTLLQQVVRELAAALTTKNAEIEKLHALILLPIGRYCSDRYC